MLFSQYLKKVGKFSTRRIFDYEIKKYAPINFNSDEEIYILFDFSCGRFYTHHSSYLKDYSDFLIANKKQTFIWVNTSADNEVLDVFSGNAKSVLRSNLYSHTSKDNLKLFFIDYIVNLSERFKISRLAKFIFEPYYLGSGIKEFKKHLQKQLPIKIIAPTLDGLGLRFIVKIMNRYHGKISLVSIRVTGAECRSIFGVSNSLEVLKKLSQKYPNKINLGFEVKALETNMKKANIQTKNIFWAPMPHILRSADIIANEPIRVDSEIRLGFLGSGRPNKGFDRIPDILDELKNKKISFKAFIQLPKFRWNDFETTLNYLNDNHSKSVIFIQSGTSKRDLDKAISDMDLIVLPYRLENYKVAGSGILFLACDFRIPIAATKDLAFSWDIEQYQIGFSFIDTIEFTNKIKELDTWALKAKIDIYNESRNQANIDFLRIRKFE